MRKRNVGLLAMSAIGAMSLAACGGGDTTTAASSAASGAASAASSAAGGGTGKVGVILPDSASSARWETADRKFLDRRLQGGRCRG